MENKYLTTSDAAKLCNVTRFTIRNWIISGKLKSTKTAGGHRRILREDVMEFLNTDKNVEKKEEIEVIEVQEPAPAQVKEPVIEEPAHKEPIIQQQIKKERHTVKRRSVKTRTEKIETFEVKNMLNRCIYEIGKYIALVKNFICGIGKRTLTHENNG